MLNIFCLLAGKWTLSPYDCVFFFGGCSLAFAVCFKSLFNAVVQRYFDYTVIEKALPIFSRSFDLFLIFQVTPFLAHLFSFSE